MRAVVRFLQDALKIRPEETTRTTLAFFYLFTTIGAFITARIAKSSLFLEIPNYKQQLPLTYIGIAIVVSFVMSRYAKVERRLRRDHTNLISIGAIIVITLGFRLLLGIERSEGIFLTNPKHEVYWAFLIWAEIVGAMLIVQFWSMVPELFTSRQAKRVFAIIGGGGVMANIAFGKLNGFIVTYLGTENLLFMMVICLVASGAMVVALGRQARVDLVAAKERAPARRSADGKTKTPVVAAFATRHVQLIGLVIVLTYLVSAMVDYQFTVIVGDEIPGKDARSAYFSNFFAYTGIIAAVIQFTMTSRILERFGVLIALLLLPLFMLGGSATVGLAMMPVLWAITLTKGSENVLRYTVNDSTLQLLYLPVPPAIRGRAKALIDGVLKPLSMGVAGFVTALLVGTLEDLAGISLGFRLKAYDLAWFVGGALLLWGVALIFLRREYLRSLLNTLHRRRLNFEEADFQIADEATVSTLEKALTSQNVGHVLHALELLPHVARKARGPLQDNVVGLIMHESQEVRVATLNYLSRHSEEERDEVAELLDDSSRDVRAAAILAYCAARRERSIERIHDLLEDSDRKVQAAAVAGLIKYGGLDGVLSCADLLKYWLNSGDALDRRHAAWVLGEVGVQNFYQPLIPLLADDSEQVRQAAVVAAGRLRNDELIGPLLAQLERPRLAGATAQALAAYGAGIEQIIADVLNDESRSSALRTQACKILGRLGDHTSVQILSQHIFDGDAHLRAAAAQALASISLRRPGLALTERAINRAIFAEAKAWFDILALHVDLQLGDDSLLLEDAINHRLKMAQAQILVLLGLVYPRETIDLVARNLQSKQATTRANAVEVLDNLLDKDQKSVVIPIFDDAPAASKLQALAEDLDIDRKSREGRLRELLKGGDPWLRTCAAMEVARGKHQALYAHVKILLDSPDPVNRETAVVVLRELVEPGRLRAEVGQLTEDPVRYVRRYALFATGETPPATTPAPATPALPA